MKRVSLCPTDRLKVLFRIPADLICIIQGYGSSEPSSSEHPSKKAKRAPVLELFWGGWLSQWFKCSFKAPCGFEDPPALRHFTSAEQYMMASKAQIFGDRMTFEQIMASSDARKIKSLGRKVANFKEKVWEEHRIEVVTRGNYAKFSQNPKLRNLLLDTENRWLVEASPYDRTWGIGLAANHPDAHHPAKWRGANLLGRCLMAARDHLQLGTAP